MNDPIYHYCPLTHVMKIVGDGLLRPSAAGARASERPALWFTSRPTYEPTAVKIFGDPWTGRVRQLTLKEQAARLGLGRFVVDADVAPLTWTEWARLSGVRPVDVNRMARKARRLGSDVPLYRATFDPVPWGAWTAVEGSHDGEDWVPLLSADDLCPPTHA